MKTFISKEWSNTEPKLYLINAESIEEAVEIMKKQYDYTAHTLTTLESAIEFFGLFEIETKHPLYIL